uniref:Uncharacterized protein n=1 Tax=Setaria italica TaxID=4555 RepID=K4AP62_SETIT
MADEMANMEDVEACTRLRRDIHVVCMVRILLQKVALLWQGSV